jgi:hypothetical protein
MIFPSSRLDLKPAKFSLLVHAFLICFSRVNLSLVVTAGVRSGQDLIT